MEAILVLSLLVFVVVGVWWAYQNKRTQQVSVSVVLPDENDTPLQPRTCRVAGINKQGLSGKHRQKVIKTLKPGVPIYLVRQPDNPYDADAVALFTAGGEDIGYLPREFAAEIAGRLDKGSPVTAQVKAVEPFKTEGGKTLRGVELELTKHSMRGKKGEGANA